ncbi:preprotein translocase subunit SecE [Arcanobacterium haemolyticum]|uniref:Protein translocase subunit SecE n=1 Tax=Arcanobacterium haemolyticum (strain ATCC 9345 / DSM 20595 / CCM 5947 / CCUG 17215 / LMG 16163 / NBRC 15585 / NCTC 8452 / 11018) TaxID=644284 RepID=D7BKC5_ARCHD|nr:preprotein translocase subunit SecE [Arcanobacterium haemolyticum]ADH93105.1 preprotein translocase, SecE subunit [Arcanobacterium haemolyticum DSM 20595]SQH28137.1 preprotein translocase subunit SecE [Arcanobacterium haemolyticum]
MSQASASNHGHKPAESHSQGFFARIIQFFREVFVELKKVQRPTRAELWKLFLTVVFFVAVVMAFVAVIDLIFAQLVLLIFS